MSHSLENCIRRRETDAAVLIITEDGETIWFPLSQVESMHFDRASKGKIVVSDWIAAEKGLT